MDGANRAPSAQPGAGTKRIVSRPDGQPFEPSNRVTLCNCGLSSIKPLYDGTHRQEADRAGRRR